MTFSAGAQRVRYSCYKGFVRAVAAVALIGIPANSYADWINPYNTDVTVWSEVGVLGNYRLVQIYEPQYGYGTLVVDCNGDMKLKVIGVGASEGNTDRVNEPWRHSAERGEVAARYACSQRVASQPDDRWFSHPGEPGSPQWSQVGRHRNFRLTWVQFNREPFTVFMAVDCRGGWMKTIGSKFNDGTFELSEEKWGLEIGTAGRLMIRYACR